MYFILYPLKKPIWQIAWIASLFLVSCETNTPDNTESFPTHFELSEGKETATYFETIDFYVRLAKDFPEVNMQTIGETDSGYPLHIITYNPEGDFNFPKIRNDKSILLINNGIHPGESDGIDATMLLYRDLVTGKINSPKNTVLVTIPIFNIGGSLNRNSTTRANQNGPKSYGFRGNALNYDLNRDFIKGDTENVRTFYKIFHLIKPDVFIDNHVSNGADYQYTLTHLFTQHNKLGGELGHFVNDIMMPALENGLMEDNMLITPYVNVFNAPPEIGFSQFMDYPRYSTGYTTLWNTLGMMVETHMLKPYRQRVEGTYALMQKMIEIVETDHQKIKLLRTEANHLQKQLRYYPVSWEVDTTKSTTISFKGFKADTLTSEVTGLPRLKYDRSKPFTKKIQYQNFFKPKDSVKIPKGYLLKKGWTKVISLLDLNEIDYRVLQKDSVFRVESYRIEDYQTVKSPYEGHYPHYKTQVSSTQREQQFEQGDLFIPIAQYGMRYLLETLEPQAHDSFFNWNFFDPILQQKEGFSPYVFEDEALQLLKENENLRNRFEHKKTIEPEFSKDWYAQLDWLFKQSEHYEASHMQYPVYRVIKNTSE
ncbi:M14 family metallopeptidase [Pareuzebyella sediminis]|uniref:M14 family metallopeptidase n=1 Tax=Pareuzebyella sediminis TaxID=2607998 RepID=UPI0011EF183F|nr:M14 family metallopeptidase [Pareuzebyella sediminis]